MCLSKEFEGSAPLQVRGHDPGSSDGSKVYDEDDMMEQKQISEEHAEPQ